MSITDNLARKGVTLYVVGCEPNVIHYRDWYMGIARKTGGQYVPLKAATLLPQVSIIELSLLYVYCICQQIKSFICSILDSPLISFHFITDISPRKLIYTANAQM